LGGKVRIYKLELIDFLELILTIWHIFSSARPLKNDLNFPPNEYEKMKRKWENESSKVQGNGIIARAAIELLIFMQFAAADAQN